MMSKESYIRTIAVFTLLMALVVAGGVMISYTWTPSWLLVIVTFLASIAFIFMFKMSDNPLVSGIGVSGMSLAMGIMIGPLVAAYAGIVVVKAVVTTAAVMGVMSFMGIVYPKVFEGWGPYLMAGLVLLIVAQFAQIIFVALGFAAAADMPLLAWLGIGIFTALVAYDWAKALAQPYTLDNAIDASGGIILDAINLFIRFLEVYGRAENH